MLKTSDDDSLTYLIATLRDTLSQSQGATKFLILRTNERQ